MKLTIACIGRAGRGPERDLYEHYAGRDPSEGTELCAVVEAMFSLEQVLAVLPPEDHWIVVRAIVYSGRPDWKALLLLGKLKERNAESIFAAIADELAKIDVELLPATTFLENSLASSGLIAGAKLSGQEEEDVDLGWKTAKEIARLDIGQTVIVKNGTVVAVEAFEGTNETIKRGATLARNGAVMVKVTKPNQDMRFDVPVIGLKTIETMALAGATCLAIDAGKCLFLDGEKIVQAADEAGIAIVAENP